MAIAATSLTDFFVVAIELVQEHAHRAPLFLLHACLDGTLHITIRIEYITLMRIAVIKYMLREHFTPLVKKSEHFFKEL